MVELIVSRRAEAELRDLWRAIAADNIQAADRLLLRLDEKLQLLREFPDIGTDRPDLAENAQMLVEGNTIVLYEHRADENLVEIIAVIDGRRDLNSLF